MTVSMRVMSAGDRYKYLLRTVAAGDGKRLLSTPLTRYYTEEGTPPGRWMGGGLRGLGEVPGQGEAVEAALRRLDIDPAGENVEFKREECSGASSGHDSTIGR